MGVRIASSQSSTIQNATVVTTAETLIVLVGPISPITDSAAVFLGWSAVFTCGTATVAVAFKLRRGSTTAAALVNVGNGDNVTAGNSIMRGGVYIDNPGAVAEIQYGLFVVQSAATSNGNVLDACLAAFVL